MSFFDDNGKIGLALIIVGLVNVLAAIIGIVLAAVNGGENLASVIVGAIGSLIFGVLIFLYGRNVRSGSNDRVAILSGFVRVLGIATILSALFVAISQFLSVGGIGAAISTVIVEIIVGLVLLWVSSKIAGSGQNAISKILWFLLVIIFLVLTIVNLISGITGIIALSIVPAILGFCYFFVYGYAFIATLSPDVKSSMGM